MRLAFVLSLFFLLSSCGDNISPTAKNDLTSKPNDIYGTAAAGCPQGLSTRFAGCGGGGSICDEVNNRCVPDEYSTIQAAVDASANGDTVLISYGTYVENIQVGTPSVAKPNLTIKNMPQEGPPILRAASHNLAIMKIIDAVNLAVTNLEFDGQGLTDTAIQILENNDNASFDVLNVHNFNQKGIDLFDPIDGVAITNSVFTDVPNGIRYAGGENGSVSNSNTIASNSFYNCYRAVKIGFVYSFPPSNTYAHDFFIDNNYFEGCTGRGLLLINAIGHYISNNTFFDNLVAIDLFLGDTDNNFIGNSIDVSNKSDPNTGDIGILSAGDDNAFVSTTVKNHEVGIEFLVNSDNNTCTASVFSNNDVNVLDYGSGNNCPP